MYITFNINTFNNFGVELVWTLKTLQWTMWPTKLMFHYFIQSIKTEDMQFVNHLKCLWHDTALLSKAHKPKIHDDFRNSSIIKSDYGSKSESLYSNCDRNLNVLFLIRGFFHLWAKISQKRSRLQTIVTNIKHACIIWDT